MAEGIYFEGANTKLTPPVGAPEGSVRDLFVFRNGVTVVSCWRLSQEDLNHIALTGEIWSCQVSGETIHPMFIGNREAVRQLTLETGSTFPGPATIPEIVS